MTEGHDAGPSPRRVALLRREDGAEVALNGDLAALGRSPDNQIVVAGTTASRRHALIQRGSDAYWVEDLGSRNGTWVNDERVTERRALEDGDTIRVGEARFVFALVADARKDAPTARPKKGPYPGTVRGSGVSAERGPAEERAR